MDTVILLYYRRPHQSEPQLVCVCDSEDAVAKKIYQLHFMHPDAYPNMSRFETTRVEHFKGVVTS